MTTAEIEQILIDQIESQLLTQGDQIALRPDDDLLMEGLDSIGFLRLIEFLEDRFSIEVPASDVTVEQFGTVERITRYVSSKG